MAHIMWLSTAQPRVDVPKTRVVVHSALIRWINDDLALKSSEEVVVGSNIIIGKWLKEESPAAVAMDPPCRAD